MGMIQGQSRVPVVDSAFMDRSQDLHYNAVVAGVHFIQRLLYTTPAGKRAVVRNLYLELGPTALPNQTFEYVYLQRGGVTSIILALPSAGAAYAFSAVATSIILHAGDLIWLTTQNTVAAASLFIGTFTIDEVDL